MRQRRRICYVSGTRADFGLMQGCLQQIVQSPDLELGIAVTGMHLSPAFGLTVQDIERAGLDIIARILVAEETVDGAQMARNIATMITGFVAAFGDFRPDIVLLLGDRGEMIAGALAALHLNIPIFHIHGGERSGTVDEPVRHAISKLSHVHLVATEESAARLIRMGENGDRVHVVGAPGLDGIAELAAEPAATLFPRYGLDPTKDMALLLYHPVMHEAQGADAIVNALVAELNALDIQILALKPNSDAGSANILRALQGAADEGQITLVTHAPRADYLALLRQAKVLIGNSSSGIIEAATFATPVINIGSRQTLRQRSGNVLDVEASPLAARQALSDRRLQAIGTINVYGDGQTGQRVVRLLATTPLETLLGKVNDY